MKKLFALFFIILFCSTQLVKAEECLTKLLDKLMLPNTITTKVDEFFYKKNLEKYAKSKNFSEALLETKKQRAIFNKRFQYCLNKENKKYVKATELFSSINTQYSLALTLASYVIFHLEDDKNAEWFKRFGFEIVATYAFSKIPGLILKNSSSSNMGKMAKELSLNVAMDYGTTRLYGKFLAPQKTKIEKPLTKEEKNELDKKLSEIVASAKFQEILKKYYMNYRKNIDRDEIHALNLVRSDPHLNSLLEQNYLELLNSEEKDKMADDIFQYNFLFNISAARPKLAMYDLTIKMLCLGYPKASIGLVLFFKLFINSAYYSGRRIFAGGI